MSIELGLQDDDNMEKNQFLKLNYIVCCNERKMGPPLFRVSNQAFNYARVSGDRMYEKVRRENNIVTVKGGGGISITASGM